MREVSKPPQNEVVDIVVGEVTSIEPLKIKVDNREYSETFLKVGALCKETHITTPAFLKSSHTHVVPFTKTEMSLPGPHDHDVLARQTGDSEEADYDVMLWRGLEVGDRVLMLKVARGQKFYVLQREEGIV